MDRPYYISRAHLNFLDALSETKRDMRSAVKDLIAAFPSLGRQKARLVLAYWMSEEA